MIPSCHGILGQGCNGVESEGRVLRAGQKERELGGGRFCGNKLAVSDNYTCKPLSRKSSNKKQKDSGKRLFAELEDIGAENPSTPRLVKEAGLESSE